MAQQITIERPLTHELRFRMSYDEYFALVDASTHSEWVDGEVTIFMTASERHQRLHTFLMLVIGMFVRATNRGIVLSEPLEMKLGSGRSYREPDLVVVLNESMHRLDGQRLNGPADIAIEILSRESVTRDRREKFAEYEQEGIPEYWVVDGRDGSRDVAVYARNTGGRYEEIVPDERGRIHSRVLPGFWIEAAWLTADELPNEFDVLVELLPERFRA